MQKDNLGALFLRGFLKSFLIIALLIGVGFASYKLTMLYYKVVEPPKDSKNNEMIEELINRDVKVEDISKNLIYRINTETGEVTGLVLEIFNTYTYNLDYITIPANTQFTISNDMYQKLCAVNPEAPQIIKLSDIYKYFEEENRYDFSEIIIEDLLSVDINYYTVMSEADFDSIFEDKDGILMLSEDFLYDTSSITEKDQLKELITGLYENVDSNLTLKNKLKYLDSFLNINPDFIYYHSLQGTSSTDYYTVDGKQANKLIEDLLANDAYKGMQDTESIQSEQRVSKGLKIEILNGSTISGLAATYKNKLEADGYTISHIGNNSDTSIKTTIIYVKEEGMAEDLLSYFNGATIETLDLPEETDIQIVLGSAEQVQ